jgi:hypothetical protein
MGGATVRRRELPVEMKFREGHNTAHRFQVPRITVEMPINIVQPPPHPGLMVLQRRPSSPLLRGGSSWSLTAMTCSTDLAVCVFAR